MNETTDVNPQWMALIGLLGGQILAYLNGNGETPQQQLIRWICQLGWSAVVVSMAIDVLAQGGLVRIEEGPEDVVIKPIVIGRRTDPDKS
jgi:hypothetical protein